MKEKNKSFSKSFSSSLSTRLNRDIKEAFESTAKEKGLNSSMLLKHIVISYLENRKKDLEESSLIQAQLISLKEKINKLETKEEWFQQLFFCWMENWFAAHPKIEDEKQAILIAKSSRKRRDDFINAFNNAIYQDDKILYDTLFANAVEDK